MKIKALIYTMILGATLLAQAPNVITYTKLDRFHDGQELRLNGARVTIHYATPVCIRAACTGESEPFGFFEVHLEDTRADAIEITVGYAIRLPEITGDILKFETFSSPVSDIAAWSVGEIRDISEVRTISVKLLKSVGEQTFR